MDLVLLCGSFRRNVVKVCGAESTPQQEIHSQSLLHTYIGTVDSTVEREERTDNDGPGHSRRSAAMAECIGNVRNRYLKVD